MPAIKDCKKQYLHRFTKNSLRGRILHTLHSRAMLIFVCTLVILECLCVMAELMVDLHGIRVQFDHEEEEINKFTKKLKEQNGDCATETRSLGDIIDFVISVHSKNTTLCNGKASKQGDTTNRGKRSLHDIIEPNEELNKRSVSKHDSSEADHEILIKRRSTTKSEGTSGPNVFVFSLHVEEGSHILVSTFEELASTALHQMNTTEFSSRYIIYTEEHEMILSVSHIIKYIGFSILSIMVVETLLKMICLGFVFFKKKIEVFDAFIVMVSFVLDVVFIDSNWYETGKDATSILVLLLPWRIVRIINSFVMTINHKHHIELMTVKRSKKKIVLKLKKLRHLTLEMRRDIDLLITLSKAKGASDPEIFNCIYGKGRGTKSLTALTSFASLMFISTLGKDPSTKTKNCDDDMYGELIKDILGDDDDDDEEDDTEIDKTGTDISTDKDLYAEIQHVKTEESFIMPNISNKKRASLKTSAKSETKITRRVTLPRRQKSCSDDSDSVYYINDAYDIEEEVPDRSPTLYKYRRNVQSLPQICSSIRGKNYVTFEVTTQVTYL